jgi:anti-anti-sigma factor
MCSYDDFEIEVQRPAAGVVLLKLSGKLGLCASFSLMESITSAIGEGPALIAADLSGVRAIESTGVKVLENAARHIDAKRTRFAVICSSRTEVWRALLAAGLHREAFVYESADEAMRPWLGDEDEDPSADEEVLV